MSLVVCKLPNAGLGNQLFPLIKGFIFAHLNKIPIIVTGYHQFKVGPYIRREKSKRNYSDYFNFQTNLISHQFEKLKLCRFGKGEKENEPDLAFLKSNSIRKLYIFSAVPQWDDFFKQLKDHRILAIELFWNSLSARIRNKVENRKCATIGVHIRMGDFRKLKEGEDFAKVGAVRTPEKYFMDVIESIRQVHGQILPVSIFTDGFKSEFQELFSLENVDIVDANEDIVDLLLLSRSKIIVTSAGSTFSYWAGFISDSPLILHPDHIYNRIRTENELFEGTIDEYVHAIKHGSYQDK